MVTKQFVSITNWFELNPALDNNKKIGLNNKYGNYDYQQDARIFYQSQLAEFFAELGSAKRFAKSIIVGSNDGNEAQLIKTSSSLVFGIDLAHDALAKSVNHGIIPILADAENLPFIESYFDTYIALRALYSTHTDLLKCLKEADRVLVSGGTLVISIPNGYVINGKLVLGMYDYHKQLINPSLPLEYRDTTITILKNLKYNKIQSRQVGAEIFITTNKN